MHSTRWCPEWAWPSGGHFRAAVLRAAPRRPSVPTLPLPHAPMHPASCPLPYTAPLCRPLSPPPLCPAPLPTTSFLAPLSPGPAPCPQSDVSRWHFWAEWDKVGWAGGGEVGWVLLLLLLPCATGWQGWGGSRAPAANGKACAARGGWGAGPKLLRRRTPTPGYLHALSARCTLSISSPPTPERPLLSPLVASP